MIISDLTKFNLLKVLYFSLTNKKPKGGKLILSIIKMNKIKDQPYIDKDGKTQPSLYNYIIEKIDENPNLWEQLKESYCGCEPISMED